MQQSKLVAELKLANNHKLKLHWSSVKRELFLEIQRPGPGRDGHGWYFTDGITLSGEDLSKFVAAISALQLPELLPAA